MRFWRALGEEAWPSRRARPTSFRRVVQPVPMATRGTVTDQPPRQSRRPLSMPRCSHRPGTSTIFTNQMLRVVTS
jgi:hypothetical protein